MPRTKSNSNSSRLSSRKPTPKPIKETTGALEKTPKGTSAEWSNWIWGEELKVYYRGRLGADEKWEYDFAATLAPIQDKKTTTTSSAAAATLVESTKHNVPSKFVYEPEPAYVYEDSYLLTVISEPAELPLASEPPAATKVEGENTLAGTDKIENEEKPRAEKPEKVTPAALKKLGKRKVQKLDRIIAYLQEEEKENRKWRKEMYRESRRYPGTYEDKW